VAQAELHSAPDLRAPNASKTPSPRHEESAHILFSTNRCTTASAATVGTVMLGAGNPRAPSPSTTTSGNARKASARLSRSSC